MKKIIYSLVIMIAAGSLFTSCIEQVEPLGIQDMRFAKAEYIRALKDLRAADAELVRAEAAHEQARARYVDAMTANLNADTEYQKLLNEYQALINEARQDTNDVIAQKTASAIDSIKKEMELRELKHAKDMADAEKALAQAREELRVALRNINLAAGDLTGPEKVALAEAVAVYYGLTEEVIKQEYNVFKAQQKVDTLTEYALRFSDTAWNGYALVDVDDYYEDAIAWEEAKIAKWMEDYEAIPDSSARVAEWKAYVDKFADRQNQLEYELAKIDANETAIASLMKEGVKDFNLAVLDFVEENWEKAGTVYTEPAKLTTEEKAIIAKGEPKQADYKQKMDTIIAFPDLLSEDFNLYGYYYYYATLLSSYNQASPVSKATTDNEIIVWKGATVDTIRIQKANQSMKAFILGADGDGDDAEVYEYTKDGKPAKITANYGLKGALTVLKRIYEEEKAALDPVETAKAKKTADSVWTAHNGILKAGLTAYAPYTTAISNFNTAKAAGKPDAMFEAMAELFAQIKTIDEQKDINAVDSSAILAAIEKFAKARDAYLDDANNGTGKNYKYADDQNPHFFYFATKTDGGKPVVDSVSFTEIATQTKFNKAAYQWDLDAKDNAKEGTNYMSNVKVEEKGRRAALNNILSQLFGVDMTNSFNKDASTAMPLGVGSTIMSATQEIIPGSDPAYQVTTTWEDPEELAAPNTDYEPAAVTTAAEKIYEAIGKYYAVYNSYWNKSLPTTKATVKAALSADWADYFDDPTVAANLTTALTGTFAKFDSDLMNQYSSTTKKGDLKADTYTATPFDAFKKDEAPLVLFVGNDIIETDALGVVLDAVDPKGWTIGDLAEESAIFNFDGTKGTDFYNRMKARYNDWLANHPEKDFEQDTKVIEDWITAVETAFENDAAKAGKDDKTAYGNAHDAWEDAVDKKAVWDEYEAALIEFTGTRVDASGDTVINGVYVITSPFDASGITAPYPLTDVKNLFATNILGVYVGWIETLGGEQLANAIEAFGEEPWEQFNEWNAEKAQYTAQKTDLSGLKTKAEAVYKAEAKMEGYDRVADAASFDAAYTAYVNAYNALRNAIVVYDEFGNIDMNNTEAKVNKAYQEIERLSHEAACYKSDVPDWEGLIAEAQKDLKIQEARLQSLKTACEYAKANYEKLKEYILSQDASYVIPVSVADIQSLLKGLGINVGDIISAYLPGVEEEGDPVVEP